MKTADGQVLQQNELLVELSTETNIARLLEKILHKAQAVTNADGGTIYLLKGSDQDQHLDFALMVNQTLNIHQGGFSGQKIDLPPVRLYLDDGSENQHNVAAHAAVSKQTVRIDDAYNNESFDFSGTRRFDESFNYRSQSFLTVPLLNHEDDVIGVLQLLNAQNTTKEVIPFSEEIEGVVNGLSSYAAIALNNHLLVDELKNLLDAFIQCIAQAIDAKSPHTSAHCQRIPLLMELIAQAACDDDGTFKDFDLDEDEWYELKVAAWLHDCGKLSTPDYVLDKSTKLHLILDGIDTIKARFASAKHEAERNYYKALIEGGEEQQLKSVLDEKVAELESDLEFIVLSNKGGEFMADENKARVREIAAKTWTDGEGNSQQLVTDEEVAYLCIERGTLSADERQAINNHMSVTIDMLESLPFPRKLRRVPEYAGGHHEKMDGTGFPKGLKRDQMSIPARMMAIADIFEALTSRDRPYKDPMKISQALNILQRMKDDDHVDPEILDLFVNAEVWKTYANLELLPEQLDI